MKIECVWEHHGNDSLIYSSNLIGAFTRGTSKEDALKKMPQEIASYCAWTGQSVTLPFDVVITQEKVSDLNIRDADSDVIFDSERVGLAMDEYAELKTLVLKSANDFHRLYDSFPGKNQSCMPQRETFYGKVPRTAEEMYQHTKNVNAYYWGEIGIEADNDGTIWENRRRGFEALEKNGDFLTGHVVEGSYGEQWSLRKVLRRFIWHDRIHAKAMYRLGVKCYGSALIPNDFHFGR